MGEGKGGAYSKGGVRLLGCLFERWVGGGGVLIRGFTVCEITLSEVHHHHLHLKNTVNTSGINNLI